MKFQYNPRLSWEKIQVYDLENGWQASVSYNVHYGEMVNKLQNKDGSFWHCSNGLDTVPASVAGFVYVALPEFARPWIEELKNEHGVFARLVRPKFKDHY